MERPDAVTRRDVAVVALIIGGGPDHPTVDWIGARPRNREQFLFDRTSVKRRPFFAQTLALALYPAYLNAEGDLERFPFPDGSPVDAFPGPTVKRIRRAVSRWERSAAEAESKRRGAAGKAPFGLECLFQKALHITDERRFLRTLLAKPKGSQEVGYAFVRGTGTSPAILYFADSLIFGAKAHPVFKARLQPGGADRRMLDIGDLRGHSAALRDAVPEAEALERSMEIFARRTWPSSPPGRAGLPEPKDRESGKGVAESRHVLGLAERDPGHFVGRERELEDLDKAYRADAIRFASIVASGGTGKTTLAGRFLSRVESQPDGPSLILGWSFYRQGTADVEMDAGAFFDYALGRVETGTAAADAVGRALSLARWLGGRRFLLLLDGLEPLQASPDRGGRIKDTAMRAFLLELSRLEFSGLVLITSRVPVRELCRVEGAEDFGLGNLGSDDAVLLLRRLGVRGHADTVREIAEWTEGLPLALELVARQVGVFFDGDIGKWRLAPASAGRWERANQIERILDFAVRTMGGGRKGGWLLYALSVFDRPASLGDLLVAFREGAVAFGVDTRNSRSALRGELDYLISLGLFRLSADGYEQHPLVRSFFRARFEREEPVVFRRVNRRLFEHFKNTPSARQPDGGAELDLLYRAIHHGALAEEHKAALHDVYEKRVIRSRTEQYSLYRLGNYGRDLAALSEFFEDDWSAPAQGIPTGDHSFLLDQIAFCLQELGRMRESIAVYQVNLELLRAAGDDEGVTWALRSMVESYSAVGDLERALELARQNLDFCLGSTAVSPFDTVTARTDLGYVQFGRGELEKAGRQFALAERAAPEIHDGSKWLLGYSGAQYLEFLIAGDPGGGKELEELRARVEAGLALAEKEGRRLHKALYLLQRAKLAVLEKQLAGSLGFFERAADAAREEGSEETLVHILVEEARWLTDALLTEPQSARLRDRIILCLREASLIIERGEMLLQKIKALTVEADIAALDGKDGIAEDFRALGVELVRKTGFRHVWKWLGDPPTD